MSVSRWKNTLFILPLVGVTLLSVGCQKKSDQEPQTAPKTEQVTVPLIESEVSSLTLVHDQLCADGDCTNYSLSTVETNLPWINDYFLNRIKKAQPNAFDSKLPTQAVSTADDSHTGRAEITVRYLGQNYNLATFQFYSFTYDAGAAHGIYNKEYVVFDLKSKKRIAVADLFKEGGEATAKEQLYNFNQSWLDEHGVSKDQLQLSDNFYYGTDGIVFVYPLYELASYAEGITELTLPYEQLKDIIKPEYLPN